MKTLATGALSIIVFLGSAIMATSACADVVVERSVKISNMMGMGGMESQEKEYIKGALKREESAGRMQTKMAFLNKMMGETKTYTIYRVDKNVVWTVNPREKNYEESPINLVAEQQSFKNMTGADKSAGDGDGNQAKMRVVRSDFKVKNTGAKKTINGFACEQHIVTWTVELEDTETKEHSTNIMTTELWNTPLKGKVAELSKQELAFAKAYQKKTGLSLDPAQYQQFGLAMLGLDVNDKHSGAGKLKREMSKIKGFPIATKVSWKVSGDKSQKSRQQAAQEQEDESGNSDMSQQLGGLLGGLMKKMGKEDADRSDSEEQPQEGVVFDSYSEIKSIETTNVDGKLFNLPSGYKKVASE